MSQWGLLHSVWDRGGDKQGVLGKLCHQKEHEIREAVEKKDRYKVLKAVGNVREILQGFFSENRLLAWFSRPNIFQSPDRWQTTLSRVRSLYKRQAATKEQGDEQIVQRQHTWIKEVCV